MLKISELFIYPVKSLGGISVTSAVVAQRGLEYDRRWMPVDNNNCFITQREFPSLALFLITTNKEGLQVTHKQNKSAFIIPF